MSQSIRILSGRHKNRRLDFMAHKLLRPTAHRLKAMVFNILVHRFYPHRIGTQSEVHFEGLHVMDLFAGIGSYGLEALSRGAAHSVFVESSLPIAQHLKAFLQKLDYQAKGTVWCKSLPDEIPLKVKVDLIFVDPPYDFSPEKVHEILKWAGTMLAPEGIIMLEFPHDISLPETLQVAFRRKTTRTQLVFFQPLGAPWLQEGSKDEGEASEEDEAGLVSENVN